MERIKSPLSDQSHIPATQNRSKTSAQDRWQQAFDASPDSISILDKEHRIITINATMAKAIGCRPEQAVGQRCCQLVHKTDSPPLGCPHRGLIEDGKPHQNEIYDEGLNQWMMIRVTPLYDETGALMGSIHIAQDITPIKQAEHALRESQERYRHLSEATMEGVLLSQEGTILTANQVMADMVGYSIEELKGQQLSAFVAPQERHHLIDDLQSDQGGHHEFTCLKKNGAQFPIEAHTRVVPFQGKMIYQTAIRDLTDQKRVQKERADNERMQGVLETAGAICHEMNQPLTAIYGYLDLLAMQLPANGPLSSKIQQIMTQFKRIQSITHKLKHITQYKTKAYARGEKIIDLDQSSSDHTQSKNSL
jgi:PAS domain S-box-containing protein